MGCIQSTSSPPPTIRTSPPFDDIAPPANSSTPLGVVLNPLPIQSRPREVRADSTAPPRSGIPSAATTRVPGTSKGKRPADPTVIDARGLLVDRTLAREAKQSISFYQGSKNKAAVKAEGLRTDRKPPFIAPDAPPPQSFEQHMESVRTSKGWSDETYQLAMTRYRANQEALYAETQDPQWHAKAVELLEFNHFNNFVSTSRENSIRYAKRLDEPTRGMVRFLFSDELIDSTCPAGRDPNSFFTPLDVPIDNTLDKRDPSRGVEAYRARLHQRGVDANPSQAQYILEQVDSGSEDADSDIEDSHVG